MKMQFVLLLEERTDFTAKQQKMEELETISFSLFPRISHFIPKFFFIFDLKKVNPSSVLIHSLGGLGQSLGENVDSGCRVIFGSRCHGFLQFPWKTLTRLQTRPQLTMKS